MKNRLINIRQAADEAMKDINVTQELKERVLNRCTTKRRVPVARLAAMAACGVLIFGILNFSGVLRMGHQLGDPDMQGTQGVQDANGTQDVLSNPEVGIFSATVEETDTETGQPDANIPNEPAVVTDWMLNTTQEAEQSFGSSFLTPLHIPEGFQLDNIFAKGLGSMIADKIILSYIAKDKTFIIIEEKMPETDTFLDDEAIDIEEEIEINGAEGFLKTSPSVSEVYWFKDGVHYYVSGQITGEEAVKVARSMK